MAETTKKVNTIKSIGKKVANNGDANDYVYIPIGADSDNIDRPDGSTVEESLENIETDKVEFIPVETLPTENIKIYPFIYALVNTSTKRGIFYEYKNNVWVKYGNSSNEIWVGTREECLAALKKNEIEKGTIVFVIKKSENSEDTHKHDYVCQITKEPTYSETGIKKYTCLLCLDSYEEEIPALVDSINPAGVIRIGSNEYCTWKDAISFNTFYNTNQTVTIEATDNETGIKEIAYYLADTASSETDLATVEWTTYTEQFQIEPNNNYIVYARIKDNADNVTYICSDGIILDNIAPVFDGLEDGGTYPEGTVITVGEGETLTVNGEAVELVDNTYTFNTADNYILSIVDQSGNNSSIEIVIHSHNFIDGICSVCGKNEYEDFTLTRENYTQAGITSLSGDIVIPETFTYNYQKYKIVSIDKTNDWIGCFYNCNEITSINLPNSLKTIGYETFRNCTSLTNVEIPSSVTTIGSNAFYNCTSLTNIEIPSSVTTIKDNAFGNCESIRNLFIPETVIEIGSRAFKNILNINYIGNATYTTSINAYDDDTNWGAYSLNGYVEDDLAFKDESKKCIKASCKVISGELIIPSTVESISNNAFYDRQNLTGHLIIPDNVKTIGEYAFSKLNITSIKLGSNLTTIGNNAFSSNKMTEGNLIIPNSVRSIGNHAFSYNNFTSISMGNSVVSIGESAFYQNKFEEVVLPSSVNEIGKNSFYGTQHITLNAINITSCNNTSATEISVIVPYGTTQIEEKAFYSGKKIISIEIPDTVISIGAEAFFRVKHIYYTGNATGSPWGALAVN